MKKIYIFYNEDMVNVDYFMFDVFGNKIQKLEPNNSFQFNKDGTTVYLLEIKREIIMKSLYSQYMKDDEATVIFLDEDNNVIDHLSVDYKKIKEDYFIINRKC